MHQFLIYLTKVNFRSKCGLLCFVRQTNEKPPLPAYWKLSQKRLRLTTLLSRGQKPEKTPLHPSSDVYMVSYESKLTCKLSGSGIAIFM